MFESQDILQHRLVDGEVRDQLLQLRILVLKLPHPPDLVRQQTIVHLLPIERSSIRNPRLAADLGKGVTVESLLKNKRLLSVREL